MKRLTLTHVLLALAVYELLLKPKPPRVTEVSVGEITIEGYDT